MIILPESIHRDSYSTQQYPVSYSMLLMPVVVIIVSFLILSRLLQVPPSTSKQVLNVLHKVPSTNMATSLYHHIQ